MSEKSIINPHLYDDWNELKKSLELNEKTFYLKEGQLWWLHIGRNLGFETYGKGRYFSRPVLVYRKLSPELFLGVPMTSKVKSGSWYQLIRHRGKVMTSQLNQVRVFSKKRLIKNIGQIDNRDFTKIKTAFCRLYRL
jgi:mRNA-degrading endonuclease toxin of MazEF toxin-antitoxin module